MGKMKKKTQEGIMFQVDGLNLLLMVKIVYLCVLTFDIPKYEI